MAAGQSDLIYPRDNIPSQDLAYDEMSRGRTKDQSKKETHLQCGRFGREPGWFDYSGTLVEPILILDQEQETIGAFGEGCRF